MGALYDEVGDSRQLALTEDDPRVDRDGPAPLKAPRSPQGDLFVCDLSDVILKDDMASMEHPFYSLTKKPDREPRRYTYGNKWIEFRPSVKGLPTIYDKDLIIYAISQIMAKHEDGDPLPKTVEIDPYAFLVYTQRGTGGRDYDALCDSLDRLDGTRFRTNVVFEGTRKDEWMGIIDRAALETDEISGKPRSLRITLSDMVLEAIERRAVLTLHRDYFRLKRPVERRVYELARKAVGQQDSWKPWPLTRLHQKSGSRSTLKEFRRAIKELARSDHLPDYRVVFDEAEDTVAFHNRGTMPRKSAGARGAHGRGGEAPPIDLGAEWQDIARKHAPAWDPYLLRQEWEAWCAKSGTAIKRPKPHFAKFCASWYRHHGEA
ncbi:replication initiator protein A [Acuticoccus sp. I52.16.1]|uniref:replication initiator protein A n=1 Tax=Acuticoccus sp. I52.16.1 TaxID=2928472 RepID=UPI001FD52872|nr:replication initiator protein A [Acuticoccus sp. I52.16.1]UOM37090.1 replication initiator protein A [Acuticoccus sp. I52.16.1]